MTKGKGLIHHGLIITVIWGMLRSIRMDIAAAIGMNEIHGESEPVLSKYGVAIGLGDKKPY